MLQTQKLPEGTVVTCREQKAGRGQGTNQWIGEAGKNIYTSILLKPSFLESSDQFQLNVVSSLALVALLKEHDISADIKWPNDIYVGKNKIAGILTESKLQGSNIQQACLGIGLNVNQNFKESELSATSIAQETGKDFTVEEIEQRLYEIIEAFYLQLKSGKDLLAVYESRIGLDQDKVFAHKGKTYKGQVISIAKDGRLNLLLTDGPVKLAQHPEWQIVIR